jgi:ankyrin repeat protein
MAAITGGKGVGISGGPNDLRQGPPDFREKANRNTQDAVQVLLDAGADLTVRDANENTALHIAAKALHPGIVKALVAKGAALDAKNKEGWTPMQLVENTPAPAPRPGFYFDKPPAEPAEIIALLKSLGEKAQ